MQEAVSTYIARAAEKIRSESLVANNINLYIRTNPFNNAELAFKQDWSIPTVVGRTNCNWSDTKKLFVCYSRWGSGSNEYETTEISEP